MTVLLCVCAVMLSIRSVSAQELEYRFDGDGKVEVASVCHKAGELYLAIFRLEEPD